MANAAPRRSRVARTNAHFPAMTGTEAQALILEEEKDVASLRIVQRGYWMCRVCGFLYWSYEQLWQHVKDANHEWFNREISG